MEVYLDLFGEEQPDFSLFKVYMESTSNMLSSIAPPENLVVGERPPTPIINRFILPHFLDLLLKDFPKDLDSFPQLKNCDGPIVWRFWCILGKYFVYAFILNRWEIHGKQTMIPDDDMIRMGLELIESIYSLDMPPWFFQEPKTCKVCTELIFHPVILTCGHYFHEKCLMPVCPECSPESFSTDPCPICMEIMIKFETTDCNHNFHEICLNKWLQHQSTCPMCRKIIIT